MGPKKQSYAYPSVSAAEDKHNKDVSDAEDNNSEDISDAEEESKSSTPDAYVALGANTSSSSRGDQKRLSLTCISVPSTRILPWLLL